MIIPTTKMLTAAALVATLSLAQANSASVSTENGEHMATGAVSLSWAPPVERTDGSLVRDDITGYRIYVGKRSGRYTQSIDVKGPGVTQYTIRGLERGPHHFAVTALDMFGNESPFSQEMVYTVR